MDSPTLYLLAADLLLFTHVLFVAFVVFGLVLILLGRPLRWSWVRNPWFRLSHVAAIGIVTLQSWLGIVCPLTTWEMAFRRKAGDATYSGEFIAHWFEQILYYRAPPWVFIVCYTMFAAFVVASWFWVRPLPFGRTPDA